MSAIFILSLDTEIAWGTYTNIDARAAAFAQYPELIRRLTCQLDIYEIPATWALVGHLLLPPGERPAVTQPQYTFADAPDSARVYGSDHPADWFYAPWLADTIQNMRAVQEIASHTMTHLLANDPAVTREMFAEQLRAVQHTHKAAGLPPPRSLVYPQNRIAHTDLLPEYGFTAYRGREDSWYAGTPTALQRPAHLVDRMIGTAPPIYAPKDCREGALVNLPASQFLMSYDGVRARIPTAARVRQARLGLQKAIENHAIYHLWFHPFNLGSGDAMFDALTRILTMVWAARERGKLRTLTMAAAAADISRQDYGTV